MVRGGNIGSRLRDRAFLSVESTRKLYNCTILMACSDPKRPPGHETRPIATAGVLVLTVNDTESLHLQQNACGGYNTAVPTIALVH